MWRRSQAVRAIRFLQSMGQKLVARRRLLGTNFLHVARRISQLSWNYSLNLKLLFILYDILCLSQADTQNFLLLYRYYNFFHTVTLVVGRSEDRILVGAGFSATLQTGPGAHPAPSTMVTGSLSQR